MKSPSDFVMVTPTYVFATPVLGGQAAVGMTAAERKPGELRPAKPVSLPR